jgi:hypothetical protein
MEEGQILSSSHDLQQGFIPSYMKSKRVFRMAREKSQRQVHEQMQLTTAPVGPRQSIPVISLDES